MSDWQVYNRDERVVFCSRFVQRFWFDLWGISGRPVSYEVRTFLVHMFINRDKQEREMTRYYLYKGM